MPLRTCTIKIINKKNQQPNKIILLCIRIMNDISNVQNNMGVEVEYYYLSQLKN
jgi:hypothetical protein